LAGNTYIPELRDNDELRTDIQWLNCGVLYVSKLLELTVYNGLAAQFLDIVVPVGEPIPLSRCLDPEREEYKILAGIVKAERELRNHVVTWSNDGSIRHVLMDSFKCTNESGGTEGMYVVMKDLGDFATLEQHMQKTSKLATVGKVAAGIAHEIRNPLTTIKGFLQMLQQRMVRQAMSEELQYIEVMLQEIDRVDALVSELLLLSKPLKVEKTLCSLERIVDELHPVIHAEALRRGVEVDCTIQPLPQIVANESMIKQVLLNLIKNAFEAMEGGGALKIWAGVEGEWIRIDVSDTGPGIPYYLMDRIFDAFYTTKDKGTGLGLPISQRIVSEHGGEIRVSSKGFGTTFTILLPTSQDSADVAM
jgi:two-component system, sporulation sensor kinase E